MENNTYTLTILSAFKKTPVNTSEIETDGIENAVTIARSNFHENHYTHRDGYYFELSTNGKLAYSSVIGYIGKFDFR